MIGGAGQPPPNLPERPHPGRVGPFFMRAGLDDGQKPMTLEEIGQKMGITKERVRQLNVRIMKKLRDIAHEQHMDMP